LTQKEVGFLKKGAGPETSVADEQETKTNQPNPFDDIERFLFQVACPLGLAMKSSSS